MLSVWTITLGSNGNPVMARYYDDWKEPSILRVNHVMDGTVKGWLGITLHNVIDAIL
jgi:hypothetical protein